MIKTKPETNEELLVHHAYHALGKPRILATKSAIESAERAATRLFAARSDYDGKPIFTLQYLKDIFNWAIAHERYWCRKVTDVPSLARELLEGPDTNGLASNYEVDLRCAGEGYVWRNVSVSEPTCLICDGSGQDPIKYDLTKLRDAAFYANLKAAAEQLPDGPYKKHKKNQLELFHTYAVSGINQHSEGRNCKCVKVERKRVYVGTD